jgi:hypothetical protein
MEFVSCFCFFGGQSVMIMVWQQWAGTATTVVNPSASVCDGGEDDDDGDDNDGDDDDDDDDDDGDKGDDDDYDDDGDDYGDDDDGDHADYDPKKGHKKGHTSVNSV